MSYEYDPEWTEFQEKMGNMELPENLDELRAAFNAALINCAKLLPATDPGIHTRDEQATPHVKVRVYTPPGAEGKKLPLVVFLHGGGWKAGNLDTEDHWCRFVCSDVNCIVVSVDYRLWSFEEYQTQNDDCYAAYQWAYEHADSLGADKKHFAVCGGSAGGSLAIAVAHKLVSSGQGDRIYGLVAMAPMAIHPDAVPEKYKHLHVSFVENGGDTPVVPARYMLEAWEQTVGLNKIKDVEWFPIAGAPEALKRFPRTYIINTGKEANRDDGRVLEAGLKDAGVPVRRDVLMALPHYFWCFPIEKAGARFRTTLVSGMKWMFSSEP